MKLQELKNISKSKSRSRKDQLNDILAISRMAMIHSTVYGEFEIVEYEDHLVFHFSSEHYGNVQETFKTREELERIKQNLQMAYYEVEDLTSQYRHEQTITEKLITKANLFFEATSENQKLNIKEVALKITELEHTEQSSLNYLLEIYAHLNKQLLQVSFTGLMAATNKVELIERSHPPFHFYTKFA